jgi:O-antigen/teichoic acid export membrane protein
MLSYGVFENAVSFLANLALVRLLAPEAFGRYAYIIAIIGIVSAIVNFRTEDLVVRVPDGELTRSRLHEYWSLLILENIFIVAASLIVLGTMGLWEVEAFIALAGTVLSSWAYTQVKIYERDFDYRPLSFLLGTTHLMTMSLVVLGAWWGIGAIVLYLRNLLMTGSRLVGLGLIGGLAAVNLRRLSFRKCLERMGEVKPIWLDGVLQQLKSRVVVVLIGDFTDEKTLGFYHQARRLAGFPHGLLNQVTTRIFYNFFSRDVSDQQEKESLYTLLSVEAVILTSAVFGAYFLADPIIPWMFGADWRPVVPMFLALSGVIVGHTLFHSLRSFYTALDYLKPLILLARGLQYLSICVGWLVALFTSLTPIYVFCVAVSASYLLPVAALFVHSKTRLRHSRADSNSQSD